MIHTNKVRRILRAKNGSQIPKFLNPAGPFLLNSFWTNPTLNTQTSSIFGLNLSNSFTSNYSNALYNPTTLGSLIAAPKPNSIDVSGKSDNAVKSFLSNFNAESEKIKQQMQNKSSMNANQIGNIMGQGADMLGSLFAGDKDGYNGKYGSLLQTGDLVFDLASNTVMAINPLVGGIMKAGGLASDILTTHLGMGTDSMTKTDAILGSKLLSLTPVGMLNGFGGKRADSFSTNLWTLSLVGGSYGGSVADINNAQAKSGKKYGLFSSGARRKANRLIADAKRQQNIMTDIAEEAYDLRMLAGNNLNYLQYNMDINGGYDLRYIRAAKSGMKLSDKISLIKSRKYVNHYIDLNSRLVEEFAKGGNIDWEPIIEDVFEPIIEDIFEPNIEIPEFLKGGLIEENWEPIIEILDNLPEYKSGGKTLQELETPEIEETTQKNIIPEGALHKNKHHIEHTEGLTKKGIPVVDNNGNLQAEVEKEEIIFSLEVTKKLEELYKDYYDSDKSLKEKDEAAIEAGKLLVYQILFNTDDRTLLIKRCEEGGKL